jgi:hypothetical protein
MEMKAGRLGGLLLFGVLVLGMIGQHHSTSETTTPAQAETTVSKSKEEVFDERAVKAATNLLAKSSMRETTDHIRAAAMIAIYRQHCALGKERLSQRSVSRAGSV